MSEVIPGRTTTMHCGHAVAAANGGPTEPANLFPLYAGCNCDMRTNNLFAWARSLRAAIILTRAWRLLEN